MRSLKHIGLGRYGDPVDAEGDRKAIQALIRMLSPGESLVCTIPYTKFKRIEFNAERVYSIESIEDILPSGVELVKRWLSDDNDNICDSEKAVHFGLLICHLRRVY